MSVLFALERLRGVALSTLQPLQVNLALSRVDTSAIARLIGERLSAQYPPLDLTVSGEAQQAQISSSSILNWITSAPAHDFTSLPATIGE